MNSQPRKKTEQKAKFRFFDNNYSSEVYVSYLYKYEPRKSVNLNFSELTRICLGKVFNPSRDYWISGSVDSICQEHTRFV